MVKKLVLLPVLVALASCGIFRSTGDRDKAKLGGERLAVLTFEAKTVADPDLAGQPVTLPPPLTNAEWPQPGGNAAKALGHVTIGATFDRVWEVSIGEGATKTRRLTAAPVVAGGQVYTIDTAATVRAFSAANGAPLWSAQIRKAGEKDNIAFGGGVSAGDGRVYATSGYGIAAAFDAATGAEAWKVDLGVPLRGAPTVDSGRVYVMTQDNQLITLSADSGDTSWESIATVEPAGLLGAAAPAVGLGTAVVGFSSGELTALRVENGRTVWQDALSRTGSSTALAALSDIDAPPVIDQGRVFAIGHGGRMVALELATGQRVWERNLAGTSLPWVAGEYIFVVTIDAELVALTRGEGRVKWVTPLPRWKNPKKRKNPIIWQGPVLASDGLFLTNSLGEVVIASPYDGSVRSTRRVADTIFLPPVIADNTLYILSEDGRLSANR
jgi:outer membrane protein assembly factor BamB